MISHKIVLGDSRYLNKIKDKSVQLIITSPPYWQLKDYGSENQIGFNDSYEEYINNLNLVWKECYRVLSDGCRLCINIGDQFARSVYYGRYKVIPIRTEIIRFCEALGMDYMGAIIWQKNTTMNTSGGGSVMGSFPYPRNGILKIDYEFILIFKKLGNAPKPTKQQKEESILSKEEWNTYFASHWTFGGAKQTEHIAMFPEELPRRLIKMFSFVNETVFDPFAGSGTTLLAAKNLGRNSIGYEINKDFIPIIKNKLNVEQNDLNNKFIFDIDNDSKNLEKDLPYIFQDPHKMNKKIDIKKMPFGSKIDNKKIEEEKFFQVKKIISPNKIEIDNNIVIKLIGIKPIEKFEKEAMDFLENKLKKRKIFLKYDSLKYDDDNNMLCYIYLKNKTFINRHLIKTGYVDVERESDYIYKKSFLSLLNIN